jgi:NAD(P)-dependent dehydrogenase (short-subunit alcohol dehydrogenase family)
MSTSDGVRIALVTGANRGIGLETSRQLAREGLHVILTGRRLGAVAEAASVLADEGLSVEARALDVTDPAQIDALRDELERRFGRLDVLVNNAGTIDEGPKVFFQNSSTTVTRDQLEATFRLNVFAVVELTQKLLPLLRAAPAGRIVNLSSILGSLGVHAAPDSPLAGMAPLAYDASKAALNMFTVHLAAALADTAIKVNSAHPGWVRTELGTDAAPMSPEEGAKTPVALALLSADGPTGQFIHLGEPLPW